VSHGVLGAIVAALGMAFIMGWEILWALVLGFALSGIVQAVVTKGEMGRLLPDSRPRTILLASALGAASSSCSYAAVALARSLFRKDADFVAAMSFPVMYLLAKRKLAVAAQLGSRALRADAVEVITCGWLSLVVVLGLLAQLAIRGSRGIKPLSFPGGQRRTCDRCFYAAR